MTDVAIRQAMMISIMVIRLVLQDAVLEVQISFQHSADTGPVKDQVASVYAVFKGGEYEPRHYEPLQRGPVAMRALVISGPGTLVTEDLVIGQPFGRASRYAK